MNIVTITVEYSLTSSPVPVNVALAPKFVVELFTVDTRLLETVANPVFEIAPIVFAPVGNDVEIVTAPVLTAVTLPFKDARVVSVLAPVGNGKLALLTGTAVARNCVSVNAPVTETVAEYLQAVSLERTYQKLE